VRFRAPDLGEMRRFLEEFGLAAVEATDRRLVMRGAGSAPVTHVTELGEPGFAGVAFRAASVADLERLAGSGRRHRRRPRSARRRQGRPSQRS
jgi:hypothetical protein